MHRRTEALTMARTAILGSPPTLAPPPRVKGKNVIDVVTRALIKSHAVKVCPVSPCKRDAMRKHVGPRLWATRQALILPCTKEVLWAKFNEAHPDRLKESKYYEILAEEVWELKRAYRETCLCRTCFNCRLHREGLAVAASILKLLTTPKPSNDADSAPPEPSEEEAERLAKLKRLQEFCASHESGRRRATTELVCADRLDQAKLACLRGECSKCGFGALWKPVRKTLVYDSPAGKLKPGVSRVWLTKIKWDRIKTGGDGSNSEDDLRQAREGTLIEFFDEVCTAYTNFTPHSFHVDQSKEAARECEMNIAIGMIRDDSDWSENGEIKVKHQLQSEYWTIVYYSMLISINAFLISKVWKDRCSALAKGAEVTVEPEGCSEPGSSEAAEGSFYAVVHQGSKEAGSEVIYTLRRPNGEEVQAPRARLRHRKWHRTAFIQITNDKKHDCFSSQAFHDRRLQFFDIWSKRGRDAALAFAQEDRAEAARKQTEAENAADAATVAAAVAAAATTATASAEEDADVAAAALLAAAAKPAAVAPPRPPSRRAVDDAEFDRWYAQLDEEAFWAWLAHSDNATHFKSKENLNYWSERPSKVDFIKMICVEYGCPGHGECLCPPVHGPCSSCHCNLTCWHDPRLMESLPVPCKAYLCLCALTAPVVIATSPWQARAHGMASAPWSRPR